MIKSPEIPTDNLYKFIALFGLTIFISSVYFFISTQQNFYSQLEENNRKHAEFLLKDSKNFSRQIYLENQLRIKELAIESKYQFSPYALNNNKAVQYFKKNTSLELDLKEFFDLRLKLHELDDEINSDKRNNDNEFKKDISNNYLTAIGVLSFMGFLMIFVGFKLWYIKTQKYIDQQLENSNKIV